MNLYGFCNDVGKIYLNGINFSFLQVEKLTKFTIRYFSEIKQAQHSIVKCQQSMPT